ncbi:MAG: hypothetical protein CVU13_01990 [Bacteroidetes bacterium HGW-Bacteroidetes-8]|jgi:tetratricopeptide (TPR) repeat protein|nr:MAG: hypothetical protein CVU13_01990 [Bacteroidetes bacterium HGW-Bacteroidetes-8]
MKTLYPVKGLIFLVFVIILSSCGPAVQFFNIDERVAPLHPVNFDNRSISVYVSIYGGEVDENLLFKNDSAQMSNLATGIASSLEKNLLLDEGAVYVFNHYPESGFKYNMEYIQSLSAASNSDVLVVVDTLVVGRTQIMNDLKSPVTQSYRSNYVFAPIRTVINVFDGITAERLGRIDQKDTVYWEILSRSDARENAIKYKAVESMLVVATTLGEDIVTTMFPQWKTVGKYLYVYPVSTWQKAYEYSLEFKWREAMEIWLEEISHQDAIRAASAAYNIALACELTDRLELAIEWIDVSIKKFRLQGVSSYKQSLIEKLEKR